MLFRSQEGMTSKPVLPEFPDIPDLEEQEDAVYESSIADIKNEVSRDDDIDMLQRQSFFKPKLADVQAQEQMNVSFSRQSTKQIPVFDEEKPLFIRINKYKEALKYLDELKAKLADAEDLFRELDSIRDEEEKKIEQWKRDLNSVKEKLLAIDKSLFEV